MTEAILALAIGGAFALVILMGSALEALSPFTGRGRHGRRPLI
jgi:hypothetical protein